MNYAKIFSLIMAVEQFAAAAMYAWQGDFRHAAYWLFAGGIILSVTL